MEFQCAARTKEGKQVNKLLTAENPSEVISRLREQGLLPLRINQKISSNGKAKKKWFAAQEGRVRSKELAVFTRQLGVTLTSGLLLTEALDAITEDLENEYFRKSLEKITHDVRGGNELSAALAKYPKIFPSTYRAIIRVGETTGKLHVTLSNLAKYLEDSERLKEKLNAAIRYPLFVMSFAVMVMAIMVFFLIPQFAEMFKSFDSQLPLLTRIVVGFSTFCIQQVHWGIILVILAWVGYLRVARYPRTRYVVDYMKLKMPIVGKNIIHKALLASYCRTLSFSIDAGVDLKTSLDITSKVVNHRLMSQAIDEINRRVIAGGSLSEEMKKRKIFTGLSAKMTRVGETTGQLSQMLEKTSQYYEDELEATLQKLTTLLEPALIVFVGCNVLIVVLALYLPIFHLSAAVK